MPNKTDIVKKGEQRCISANALEKFVSDVRRRLPKESRDFFTRDEMLLNFEQYIHLQPTADVRENKTGEWIIDDGDSGGGYESGIQAWIDFHCSECGTDFGFEEGQYGWSWHDEDNTLPYQFCPVCGIKMKNGRRKNGRRR